MPDNCYGPGVDAVLGWDLDGGPMWAWISTRDGVPRVVVDLPRTRGGGLELAADQAAELGQLLSGGTDEQVRSLGAVLGDLARLIDLGPVASLGAAPATAALVG